MIFFCSPSPESHRCRWGSHNAEAGRTCVARVPGTFAGLSSRGLGLEGCDSPNIVTSSWLQYFFDAPHIVSGDLPSLAVAACARPACLSVESVVMMRNILNICHLVMVLAKYLDTSWSVLGHGWMLYCVRSMQMISISNLPTNNYKSYNNKRYQQKTTNLPTIKQSQSNIKETLPKALRTQALTALTNNLVW